MTIDQIINALESTPVTLRSLLESVPPEYIVVNEGPDTFSAYDVVGHLIHGEQTDWMPRLRRILEFGEKTPFDPFDRFAQQQLPTRSLSGRLDEFAHWRSNNVAALKAHAAGGLNFDLKGMHPDLGPVTLGQLLHTWVLHDWSHLGQIARVLSKQLGPAVGPWQAYFRILTR